MFDLLILDLLNLLDLLISLCRLILFLDKFKSIIARIRIENQYLSHKKNRISIINIAKIIVDAFHCNI